MSMRLSRSIVGEAEAEAVRRVIVEDGYLGMGHETCLFEQELAAYLGVAATSSDFSAASEKIEVLGGKVALAMKKLED